MNGHHGSSSSDTSPGGHCPERSSWPFGTRLSAGIPGFPPTSGIGLVDAQWLRQEGSASSSGVL